MILIIPTAFIVAHSYLPGSPLLLPQADSVVASWSQTTDDVLIKVQVPPATRGRDIKFDLHPKRMSVELDGRPLLFGSLSDVGEVKVDGEGLQSSRWPSLPNMPDLLDPCQCALSNE